MDIALLIFAILSLLVGCVGSIYPIIPGLPLCWLSFLLLRFTSWGASISTTFLIVTAVITILLVVLDYIIPMFTTRKFGGSKAGSIGALLGMLIGAIFMPILGLILGCFIGAFLGELYHSKAAKYALKAAWGAFVGFLLSTGIKLIVTFYMLIQFIVILIQNVSF